MGMRQATIFIDPILRNLFRLNRRAARAVLGTGLSVLVACGSGVLGTPVPALALDPSALISVNLQGTAGNGPSGGVALNLDGSVVAFFSDATALVPNDTNQARDVFVRAGGTTQLVSVGLAGNPANGPSHEKGQPPAISDNGQIVAFYSDATNLVPNDNNGQTDVFVRDLTAGATELISVSTGGEQGNGPSLFPSISGDGRFVVFQSLASNLVPGDTNGVADIFIRDRVNGTTDRVCNLQGNSFSLTPAISGDGNFVAFVSAASDLVSGDTNGHLDIFVCNRSTAMVERVSLTTTDTQADGDSILPAISGDGCLVAFKSLADNLVPNDLNTVVDVFARDRCRGITERISVNPMRHDANDFSFPPSVSRDGRFVAFGSYATNLVEGDVDETSDVFVRDRNIGVTMVISEPLMCGGSAPRGASGTPDVPPSVSGDGTRVGFVSFSTNLVPADTSTGADVYVAPNPFELPGSCPDGTCPTGLVCFRGCCEAPTPTFTATPEGTLAPTPTPTPPIPCFIDQDCPISEVCINGVCTEIPCDTDNDCPDGRPCVNGVCNPKPITPTPLPTCTMDSDCVRSCTTPADCPQDPIARDCVNGQCAPVDRCRAGFCVPPRECTATDLSMCRGERETCVDGFCECGGDCNLDGFVFGNEITQMVCVLTENCPLTDCEAGDFNGDGHITSNEVCLAVRTNLGFGCPAEGLALLFAHDRPLETRTLEVGSATGMRGRDVNIGINLGGGDEVASAQLDLLFDTDVLDIPDPTTACAVDGRLVTTETSFTFLPQSPVPEPGDHTARMRLYVSDLMLCQNDLSFPLDAFDSGPLLSCTFHVRPDAPLGHSALTPDRLNIGDPYGAAFGTDSAPGVLIVVAEPCTDSTTCPMGLVCRDSVCVAECSQDSDCPAGQVCRNQSCETECTQDSDCMNGDVCRNEFCVPTCMTDSDCQDGLVCRQDACVPPCMQNADCPAGSVCVDGGCENLCTTDADCPTGQVCRDGTCEIGCTQDSECQQGYVCLDGACEKMCTQDSDCGTGEKCVDNVCKKECTQDSDCLNGDVCRNNVCVAPGQCVTFSDCRSDGRQACVSETCQCTGDCSGDMIVDSNEIIQMLNILRESLPLDGCLAGDANGDGVIDSNEIILALLNLSQGCPATAE
jgi:Cys-rich repeat protein